MRPDRPDIAGYRILRRLGHGGMSEIWLAEQVALARPVAVKVVNQGEQGEERQARFRQEAAIVARFDHPNVVGILEFGQTADGRLFFSMPYVPGGTLAQAAVCGDGPRTRQVLVQLLDALEYIHAHGVVHRDVKPENVLFDSVGRARLADFGVSRSVSAASRHTRVGETLGSIHYMSPEQARGELPDGRSDLYSLGAIAYELLTGAPPFQGPDDISVVVGHLQSPLPELPEHLGQWQRWLARALAKRPADRFPDAAAMRDALNRVPDAPRSPWLSPKAREAVLRAGLPAMAVLVLGVVSGWLWFDRGETGRAVRQVGTPATAPVATMTTLPATAPASAVASDVAVPGAATADDAAASVADPPPARPLTDQPLDAAGAGVDPAPGTIASVPVTVPAPPAGQSRPSGPATQSARPQIASPSRAPGSTPGAVGREGAQASRERSAAQPASLPRIGSFEQVPSIPLLLLSGTREQQISRLDAWLEQGRQVMDADRSTVTRARRASSDRRERDRLQAGLDHRRANYEDWRRQVLALRRQVERQG